MLRLSQILVTSWSSIDVKRESGEKPEQHPLL